MAQSATRRGRAQPAPPANVTGPATLLARLSANVTLEAIADGTVAACFEGHVFRVGRFSAAARKGAQTLRAGVPISLLASPQPVEREINVLARQLAAHGLLEYRLARAGEDEV